MLKPRERNVIRKRIHARIREKMSGTPERPRLNVSRSLNHIYTAFVGAHVTAGSYSSKITHYTVLRTIETAYGLPVLGGAANVSPITYVWS